MFSASVIKPLALVLVLAMCSGLIVLIGAVYAWFYYITVRGISSGAPIMFIRTIMVVGILLTVAPLAVYVAKIRGSSPS